MRRRRTYGNGRLTAAGADVPNEVMARRLAGDEIKQILWITWPRGRVLLCLFQEQIRHCSIYLCFLTQLNNDILSFKVHDLYKLRTTPYCIATCNQLLTKRVYFTRVYPICYKKLLYVLYFHFTI